MAALFKPYRVTKAKLDNLAIKDGQLIYVTDTQEIYLDISDTQRIQVLSDHIKEISIEDGQLTTISSKGDTVQTPLTMQGATESDAGSGGMTPAPAAGEQTHFLRGDGTWHNLLPADIGALGEADYITNAEIDEICNSEIVSGEDVQY